MNQTIDDWFILDTNVPKDNFIFRHKNNKFNHTRDDMISNKFTDEQLQQIIDRENSKERLIKINNINNNYIVND